jgi:nucleotide-binding universal stress UspA family protein
MYRVDWSNGQDIPLGGDLWRKDARLAQIDLWCTMALGVRLYPGMSATGSVWPPLEGVVMPGILVGIDGSDHSRKALEWAVREAGLRGTSLTVLAVHQVATNYWTGSPETHTTDAPETEMVRQAAEADVQKAVSQVGGPAPTSVTVRAVTGVASRELVAASADADLVVVGSRGGGGFSKMVLGSVTSQVTRHADSPVVVIR